jgi:hypothetical protein
MVYGNILTNVDYCHVPFCMSNFFFIFNPMVIWIQTRLACLIQIIQVLLCLMFYNDAHKHVMPFSTMDKVLFV